MRFRYHTWLLIAAIPFAGVSCQDKPEPAEAEVETTEAVVEQPADVVVPADEVVAPEELAKAVAEAEVEMDKAGEVSALSVEERAAKMGFARYLREDTEALITVFDAKGSSDKLQDLELVKVMMESNAGMGGAAVEVMPEEDFVEEDFIDDDVLEDDVVEPQDAEQGDEPLAEDAADLEMPEPAGPWTLLGREVTLAMGAGTSEQTGNLVAFNESLTVLQAEMIGLIFLEMESSGEDGPDFGKLLADQYSPEVMQGLIDDPDAGISLFEKTEMPPMILAFRAKDGEIDQAGQMLAGGMEIFGMAGEMATPVTVETAGTSFTGYTLLGAKIAETMKMERASLDETLGAENVDRFLEVLSEKDLTVVTGVVDDYAVLMIGGDKDKLLLESELENSFVAGGNLAFTDAFADKEVITVLHGKKKLLEEVIGSAGTISYYAEGFRNGILKSDKAVNLRDFAALLQILGDREQALLDLYTTQDHGLVAFIEDGLKIENFGGFDSGSLNWEAENQFAHLEQNGEPMFFLNTTRNTEYNEKLQQYGEALFETLYAISEQFSQMGSDSPTFRQFKDYKMLFDEKFSADVAGLYDAISGPMSEGIGAERAVIIDGGGAFPAVPGVPQAVVDNAKAPRITVLAPVEDRSKLAEAWEEMDKRATSIFANVSEVTGEKIPMQKPISSETNGMKTWFFSFPFFQDDFMPSVTVSDDLFAASTSKVRAVELMTAAAGGGPKAQGIHMHINFEAITAYAEEALKIIEENKNDIFLDEGKMEEFERNRANIVSAIEASKELIFLDWSSKAESDYVRTSIHLKTK